MKMRLQVMRVTPDPTQYKKFLTDYEPETRIYVELDVPDDLVVDAENDGITLTEDGMVVMLAKLGKVAKDAEQMFYQLDKE